MHVFAESCANKPNHRDQRILLYGLLCDYKAMTYCHKREVESEELNIRRFFFDFSIGFNFSLMVLRNGFAIANEPTK